MQQPRPQKLAHVLLVVLCLVGSAATAWGGSPCDKVNRDLPLKRKEALSAEIAKQLGVKSVEVLQSFRLGTWQIIYVATPDSDPPFLFYSSDPLKTRYLTEWSGAARVDEEQEIKTWTLENAPGIPHRLASCFAWHVTKARDQ